MVAVADFNNDGKPDIAVVGFGDPTVGNNGGVSILIGNGDGTFQQAKNLTVGKNLCESRPEISTATAMPICS